MPLPAHLVQEYWSEVQELLATKYGLTEDQARTEIRDYRDILGPLVGETVYNASDPPRMAQNLANAFRNGGIRRVFPPEQYQTTSKVS